MLGVACGAVATSEVGEAAMAELASVGELSPEKIPDASGGSDGAATAVGFVMSANSAETARSLREASESKLELSTAWAVPLLWMSMSMQVV